MFFPLLISHPQKGSARARMFREAVPRECQAGSGAFQDGLKPHHNKPEDKARDKAAAEEVLNVRTDFASDPWSNSKTCPVRRFP